MVRKYMIAALLLFFMGTADTLQAAGKKVAVLIGVKRYNNANFANLYYTENDVVELAKLLRPKGFEVTLLSDSQTEDFLPTRKNIIKHLEAALKDRQREDIVVFGFAGHGLQFKDDQASYFLPRDAAPNDSTTMISLKTIYEKLEFCGADVKLMFVDACRNQVDKRLRSAFDGDTTPAPPKGVCALFSCAAGQSAMEMNELRHGLFFYHVLDGLRGKARDSDNDVTVLGVAQYAMKQVKRAGYNQTPVLKGEVTDGVLFRLPKTETPNVGTNPIPVPMAAKTKKSTRLGMELVLIPPGSFLMGAPGSDGDAEDVELPQHSVKLKRGLWMATCEVSQKMFHDVTGERPSVARGDNLPVTNVTWIQAIHFCNTLSRRETLKPCYSLEDDKVRLDPDADGYRLPTEAEWEYCCRAGTKESWHFRKADEADVHEWLLPQSENKPHPVGSKKANPFGLFDMHGNVMEWCWDGHRKYTNAAATDPVGPVETNQRIVRGGTFQDSLPSARASARFKHPANHSDAKIGFRVVRTEVD